MTIYILRKVMMHTDSVNHACVTFSYQYVYMVFNIYVATQISALL
jgi:hypothetical protein